MNFKHICSNIKGHLLLPFQNLNTLDKLIQCVRLVSSVMGLLFGMIITLVPYYKPQNMYIGKLNTLRANIAKGVFTVLMENFESNSLTNINNGVGLTTSEILVLTSYTFQEVQDIPAYILVTLYGDCDAKCIVNDNDNNNDTDNYYYYYYYYDGSARKDDLSLTDSWNHKNNTKLNFDCQYWGPDYLFDYRAALNSVGLHIVLEYAYGSSYKGPNNEKSSYESYIQYLSKLKQCVLKLFFFVLAIELVIILLTLWYYYIKGRKLNHSTEKFLLHLLSFLSLFVFVAGTISVLSLLYINYSMKTKITEELKAFGFSYRIGEAWTTCMVFWIFFSSVLCLVWSGLEWCVSTNDSSVDSFDGNEMNVNSYYNKNNNDTDKKNQTHFGENIDGGDNNVDLKFFESTESSTLALLPVDNNNNNNNNNNNFNLNLNDSTISISSTSAFVSKSDINKSDHRTQQRYINTNGNNNEVDGSGSEYELQSIELRFSSDSDSQLYNLSRLDSNDESDQNHYCIQRMVIPSSAIQF